MVKDKLGALQKVAKIGKIVSKVLFVCSIVSTALCAVGLVCLGINAVNADFDLSFIFDLNENLTVNLAWLKTINLLVLSAGGIVINWFALRYCDHTIQAGTPFTEAGSREIWRLGLIAIITEIVTVTGAAIATETMAYFMNQAYQSLTGGVSLGFGLMCLVLSVIFSYVAEHVPAPTASVTVTATKADATDTDKK